MKRMKWCIVLVCMCVVLAACSQSGNNEKKSESKTEEGFFTNDFCTGMVKIISSPQNGDKEITNQEAIAEICGLFRELNLQQMEKPEEIVFGTDWITFEYEDGTKREITFTSEFMSYEGKYYELDSQQGKEFCEKLRQIFAENE